MMLQALALLALCLRPLPQARAAQESGKEIDALIDRLVETKEGDLGYMSSVSGFKFSPIEGSGRTTVLLLGEKGPVGSAALQDLVKRGAASIPRLIAHLGDSRATPMEIRHERRDGGMIFQDEYDCNRRTAKILPEGVNRWKTAGEEQHPNHHTLTVGDLCFVAIGQIVNRQFSAVRYQPSSCVYVNSPTYSEALRNAVRREWEGLTAEKHRESLLADIRTPDFQERRQWGIQRLAYYYPESAEAAILEELAKPMFCSSRAQKFVRESLLATGEPKEWKRLCEAWTQIEGDAFKVGMLLQLLDDARRSPPFPEWKADPKIVLETLFPNVDRTKPLYLNSIKQSEQARFIDAIAVFHSPAVDKAVMGLFGRVGSGQFDDSGDEYFAVACIKFLIGRGYDPKLKEYCEKRLINAPNASGALYKLRDRLDEKK